MRRGPDRGLLALLPPFALFVVFGAARVDAPIGLIGLIFGRPWEFAIAALVIVFGGAALLFVGPIETRVAGFLAPSREPTPGERERLGRLLGTLAERSRIDTGRLIVRIQDSDQPNAAAGAAHLLFVTSAALKQPDAELEALLAHEVGHHRGLHPVATMIVWWLSVPGEVLASAFRALRAIVTRLVGRVRILQLVGFVVIFAWQITVMWVYYVGQVLAQRASRVSEYSADRAAADWGYSRQLVALYESFGEEPSDGLVDRVMASHPPLHKRIDRLVALG